MEKLIKHCVDVLLMLAQDEESGWLYVPSLLQLVDGIVKKKAIPVDVKNEKKEKKPEDPNAKKEENKKKDGKNVTKKASSRKHRIEAKAIKKGDHDSSEDDSWSCSEPDAE